VSNTFVRGAGRIFYLMDRLERQRLALLIKQLDLSDREIADRLALKNVEQASQSSVAKWRKSARKVKLETAEAICRAFGVDPLFLRDQQRGPEPSHRDYPLHAGAQPELERWLDRMGDNIAPRHREILRSIDWRGLTRQMYIVPRETMFKEAALKLEHLDEIADEGSAETPVPLSIVALR